MKYSWKRLSPTGSMCFFRTSREKERIKIRHKDHPAHGPTLCARVVVAGGLEGCRRSDDGGPSANCDDKLIR